MRPHLAALITVIIGAIGLCSTRSISGRRERELEAQISCIWRERIMTYEKTAATTAVAAVFFLGGFVQLVAQEAEKTLAPSEVQ